MLFIWKGGAAITGDQLYPAVKSFQCLLLSRFVFQLDMDDAKLLKMV